METRHIRMPVAAPLCSCIIRRGPAGGNDMGLFDFIFDSKAAEIHDPDQLKAALFKSAWAGDAKHLEQLCRANQQRVVEHFPGWQKVPDEVRRDQAAMQRYV